MELYSSFFEAKMRSSGYIKKYIHVPVQVFQYCIYFTPFITSISRLLSLLFHAFYHFYLSNPRVKACTEQNRTERVMWRLCFLCNCSFLRPSVCECFAFLLQKYIWLQWGHHLRVFSTLQVCCLMVTGIWTI